MKSAPQARISQFLGALIKGATKPVPLSVKTETANAACIESSYNVKHVLVEKIQTSHFFANPRQPSRESID
ncbi:protein of unknown function (plasmid) [Caballeronia sp. S22]